MLIIFKNVRITLEFFLSKFILAIIYMMKMTEVGRLIRKLLLLIKYLIRL